MSASHPTRTNETTVAESVTSCGNPRTGPLAPSAAARAGLGVSGPYPPQTSCPLTQTLDHCGPDKAVRARDKHLHVNRSKSASTIIRTSSAKLTRGAHASALRVGGIRLQYIQPPRQGRTPSPRGRTFSTRAHVNRTRCRTTRAPCASHPYDDEVGRRGLLQHAPHCVDVVAGESPIAAARRDCRGAARWLVPWRSEPRPWLTLAGDELQPAAR